MRSIEKSRGNIWHRRDHRVFLDGDSDRLPIVWAKTAHLLPAKQLKYLFITVAFYMGLKMIGVFAWLHLPI